MFRKKQSSLKTIQKKSPRPLSTKNSHDNFHKIWDILHKNRVSRRSFPKIRVFNIFHKNEVYKKSLKKKFWILVKRKRKKTFQKDLIRTEYYGYHLLLNEAPKNLFHEHGFQDAILEILKRSWRHFSKIRRFQNIFHENDILKTFFTKTTF